MEVLPGGRRELAINCSIVFPDKLPSSFPLYYEHAGRLKTVELTISCRNPKAKDGSR